MQVADNVFVIVWVFYYLLLLGSDYLLFLSLYHYEYCGHVSQHVTQVRIPPGHALHLPLINLTMG